MGGRPLTRRLKSEFQAEETVPLVMAVSKDQGYLSDALAKRLIVSGITKAPRRIPGAKGWRGVVPLKWLNRFGSECSRRLASGGRHLFVQAGFGISDFFHGGLPKLVRIRPVMLGVILLIRL